MLQAICLGQCKSTDLPTQLDLSDNAAEMNRLWRRSIREIRRGIVTEYGAILAWQRGKLRLAQIARGTSNAIVIKPQVDREQKIVGTFHTHPYKEGWLGITFSGEDFASAINTQENVSVVHSGNRIAALVRNEKSSKSVDSDDIIDLADVLVRRYYSKELIPFDEAALKMNVDLCTIHKSAFYLGAPDGRLTLRYKP
jgi:hypothetical protein